VQRLSDALPGHYVLPSNLEAASIKIEMVRELQTSLSYRMGSDEHQEIVLLYADLITPPAQHALLKLIEEPPPQTRFWLVTTTPAALLETIRSRCQYLDETLSTTFQLTKVPPQLEPTSLVTFATTPLTNLSELAGQVRDRDEAIGWCTTLLHLLQPLLPNADSAQQATTRAVLTALERLKANGNVRLVLEDCFFTIRLAYQPRV
jgi:hypothetical protein